MAAQHILKSFSAQKVFSEAQCWGENDEISPYAKKVDDIAFKLSS